MSDSIHRGSDVMIAKEYSGRFPRLAGLVGTVVGESRDGGAWWVQFAGRASSLPYHKDFIVAAKAAQAQSRAETIADLWLTDDDYCVSRSGLIQSIAEAIGEIPSAPEQVAGIIGDKKP